MKLKTVICGVMRVLNELDRQSMELSNSQQQCQRTRDID
jgi:hypothetical protein